MLRQAHGFTIVAVAVLAIGIGANSAIFSVKPLDPVAFLIAPAVSALVALVACAVPVRASRVDPAVALRQE